MGEEGETMILLSDGHSYPILEMDKLKQLVEKHWTLLNFVDPDKERVFERINEEGKECSWHVKDDSSRVADELSALWSRLTEFARTNNLKSLEDDGGMEHEEYNQIVEYFKTENNPYENAASRATYDLKRNWLDKCKQYSLDDDRMTLRKSSAVVLKKGEVMQVLSRFHQICGHAKPNEMILLLQSHLYFQHVKVQYQGFIASCSCGYNNKESIKDFKVFVRNTSDKEREIVFSHGNIDRKDEAESIKTPEVKILHGITESKYQKELEYSRSPNARLKYKIASDRRTLVTGRGAIVLKDNEALYLCLRIHEYCGHTTSKQMVKILPKFICVPRMKALATAVVKKCHLCRCKNNTGKCASSSPVNVQNVKLVINVHYEEGAVDRRFEVIVHGVDGKVVDDYVKNTIEALKKYGKWKEPVFSPEASLANSVLRIVHQLRKPEEGDES